VAQAYLALGQAYVELAMQIVVRPIWKVHATLATIQGWTRGIAGFIRGGK
jgi:hypothetical protein